MDIENLKHQIREYMFSHDLTIPEFAKRAGLGTRTIISILGGETNLTLRTVWKIQHLLNVKIELIKKP